MKSPGPCDRCGSPATVADEFGDPQYKVKVSVLLCESCDAAYQRAIKVAPNLYGNTFYQNLHIILFWGGVALVWAAGWLHEFLSWFLWIPWGLLSLASVFIAERWQEKQFEGAQAIVRPIRSLGQRRLETAVEPFRKQERAEAIKRQREAEQKEREYRAKHFTTNQDLFDLGGQKFEVLIAALLAEDGYVTKVTKGSGDGGVDIVVEKNGEAIYVQCKNHKSPISPGPVRGLYGTMTASGVKRGIIVSSGSFSRGAIMFGKGKGIEFIGGKQVLSLIEKHGMTKR